MKRGRAKGQGGRGGGGLERRKWEEHWEEWAGEEEVGRALIFGESASCQQCNSWRKPFCVIESEIES